MRHQPLQGRDDPDHGAVTVETAVVMPALILLLAVLLAAVEHTAREIAGDAASVQVYAAANRVTVAVSGPAPGVLGQWSDWRLHADATAAVDATGGDHDDP